MHGPQVVVWRVLWHWSASRAHLAGFFSWRCAVWQHAGGLVGSDGIWHAGVSLLVLLSLLWRAVTPWDLRPAPADPEHPISLSPFALTGGCANVNAPAYTEQAVSVDATLAKFGAKRIPNVTTNDCGYVALHLWDHDTQPDVRAMRKQLYDTGGHDGVCQWCDRRGPPQPLGASAHRDSIPHQHRGSAGVGREPPRAHHPW